jgi:lipoprotein-anchoring transpeptidase ErfK/SrfK
MEENSDEVLMPGPEPLKETIEIPVEESGSFFEKIKSDTKIAAVVRSIIFVMASVFFALFFILFMLYFVPYLQEKISHKESFVTNNPEFKKDAGYKKQVGVITRDIQRLSRKYASYTSGQSYIVINTTDNRFFLYRNKQLIREGFCSSGSYTMLKAADGNKKWIFKTPKGKYHIQGKTTHPVWRRPDWAFVEEGLPIPSQNDPSRYEYGVLGDYALALGDGYLIHGTIYKRFLGMPVTHGCVRLNDEDLEVIFNTLSIGSKVYIF